MSTSYKQPADNPKSRQFKGVRQRKWGKWVCEVRIPNCKGKIWLGSYKTAEQAARAFDAATYCLRGAGAKFNFPNSIPAIPSASSLSPQQIRLAAANHALARIPRTDNTSNLTEKAVSPSRSSLVPETTKDSIDAIELISMELDPAMWDSLLADSDCNQYFNVMNFPFPDAVASPKEEQGSVLLWDL
ncbi:hypothetical protein SUGI_0127230 [Cryptomeria japonica]|uniref:ethylene-responsive transcription factor ERF018 n=1 Tax=Cryptomeria japonica TaxID=3369 RepID=UPI002408AEC4|nr:ethylene-responsive transcription factor ERF018 [Cryptomeria japonica]GLJ10384.1 hypothetical protein SUGI_0127230 [Cryptomeria japonica]